MTIAEAIQEFRTAADSKADGVSPASKDRALHARMARALGCLSLHGSDGLVAFSALLHDQSPHVRSWVAAELLAAGDRSAVPIMEQLAAEPGIRGFTAATTLKEFHAGRLQLPFATNVA
jgi:hypothetical protein